MFRIRVSRTHCKAIFLPSSLKHLLIQPILLLLRQWKTILMEVAIFTEMDTIQLVSPLQVRSRVNAWSKMGLIMYYTYTKDGVYLSHTFFRLVRPTVRSFSWTQLTFLKINVHIANWLSLASTHSTRSGQQQTLRCVGFRHVSLSLDLNAFRWLPLCYMWVSRHLGWETAGGDVRPIILFCITSF